MSKRTSLRLIDKLRILELLESKKCSMKEIRATFNCGRTQVYELLKRKDEILREYQKGMSLNCKRRTMKTVYEEINALTWEWFVQEKAQNVSINGPMIQEKARQIAAMVGNRDFKASNGWLDSFKARHHITNLKTNLESNMDGQNIKIWKEKLEELTSKYDPVDIFSGAEMTLPFVSRATSTEHLSLSEEKCSGDNSEQKLNVFLCSNMCGNFEKPFVVGNEIDPIFRPSISLQELSVTWRQNAMAQYSHKIIEDWLLIFDKKMEMEKRKVILFLVKVSIPDINLSNVQLVWFPENAVQPLQQGITYCVKSHYRKMFMQAFNANGGTSDKLDNIFDTITTLEVIKWISEALENVQKDTVTACFLNAGFSFLQKTDVKIEENRSLDREIDFSSIDDEKSLSNDGCSPERLDCPTGWSGATTCDTNLNCNYPQILESVKSLQEFSLGKGDSILYFLLNKCKLHIEKQISRNEICEP